MTDECPKCGSRLVTQDHIVRYGIVWEPFECSNEDCGYSGKNMVTDDGGTVYLQDSRSS